MSVSTVPGYYFDGESPNGVPVSIEVTSDSIAISPAPLREWPRRSCAFTFDPDRRFARIELSPGGQLLISEPSAIDRINGAAAAPASAFTAPRLWAAIAIACLFLAALWFSFPWMLAQAARALPRKVDSAMGWAVANSLAPRDTWVRDRSVKAAMASLVQRLGAHRDGSSDLPIELEVINNDSVNASAAPGGFIGVNRRLICLMQSPDELASVVAHEISHVEARHATQNVIRTMGARMFLFLLAGGADPGLDTAVMLGSLQYQRNDERWEDENAIRILAAAEINPLALSSAFTRFSKESRDLPSLLQYLSTHPSTEERHRSATAASRFSGTTRPSMSDVEWGLLRSQCGCGEALGPAK